MRRRFGFLLVLLTGLGGGIGCASHPLALSAEVGATIAIPIGTQLDPASMGYGGTWYEASNATIFDDQRGRLTFTFVGPSDTSDPVEPLLVTRMFPDPTTKAAKNGEVKLSPSIAADLSGQIVALVNVPDVLPDLYNIQIGRKIRIAEGVWDDTVTPVPFYDGQVQVLASTGTANEPKTTADQDLINAMDDFYPRPTVELILEDPVPAAGHIVLSFPDTKANHLDLVATRKIAQDSMISGELTGSVLEIDFVSPNATVDVIGVVFNPSDPFGAGVPQLSDFVVDENLSRLYDADGVRIHNTQNPSGIDSDAITVWQIR